MFCKVSGLITQAPAGALARTDFRPHVAHAIDVFTPQRLMFGSDWPVCLLGGEYADALALIERSLGGLGAGERRAVMGANAARVYLGEA